MRSWILAAIATVATVVYVAVLRIPGLSPGWSDGFTDFSQVAASTLAALGCAVAGRRTAGHRRLAWQWLALGTASWAAGQAAWTYYEVILGRAVPFPSLADIGFLGFPLAAGWGLVRWLGTQADQKMARGRDVMDGAIIAGSLLLLSWVTALGAVASAGGSDGWFSLALSLAYPVGDLILATLVLIALTRGSVGDRHTLLMLTVGLVGFSAADSAFVYLTSTASFSSTDLISNGGWFFGFLFVGAAGLSVDERPAPGPRAQSLEEQRAARPSGLRLSLPYLPLVAAIVVLCVNLLRAPSTPTVALMLGMTLVGMVLLRQFLAMLDNQRLLVALADARDQLEHQALHDSLTNLPNRVLFADRLDHALLRPQANVSVMFCDLDDFKNVNDDLGHEAGDELLREIARRLQDCVRSTDTVARLGGDEFAILLDDSNDAVQVAERVVDSMRDGAVIGGQHVRTSISVGIAHHQGDADPGMEPGAPQDVDGALPRRRTTLLAPARTASAVDRDSMATLLLRRADMAMYAAKGAGKGRAVMSDVDGAAPTLPAGLEIPTATPAAR